MKRLMITAGLLSVALSAVPGWHEALGQDSPSASTASDAQLKLSPLKALEKFEPAADEQYELGPGDEISLDFPGRPELSGKRTVGPDGRITLSLVGPINVADKTRLDVAKMAVTALSAYYQDLTVTVNVEKYGSNRIVVIGSVAHPGVLYFDSTPTLLDVIARSGLMSTPGATAARDGIPERCAIYRGNDKVLWIDLRMLLQSGNSLADLRLRRNDIVFVPSQQEVFVSVLGSVAHPGAIALTPQSTLISVLAQAGGLAEGAASSKIQIIQPSTGKISTVSFKSLLTVKGTDEVSLHAGDVVYVPTTAFFKTTYVIQRVTPGASLGMAAAVAQ